MREDFPSDPRTDTATCTIRNSGQPRPLLADCVRGQTLERAAEVCEIPVQLSIVPARDIEALPLEIVERKGMGHPDTICDALAEQLSLALSRYYLERFGAILHHNVDKVLLRGGAARAAFGGGQVLEPIDIYFAGRAVHEWRGVRVPIEELAIESARSWLRSNLRTLDADRHVRLHCLVRPGSADLVGLFERSSGGAVRANDTSCGVGYAPHSRLERAVLAAATQLNSTACRQAQPFIGEDVKVMGVRAGDGASLTVACAVIDRHVDDLADYVAKISAIATEVERATRGIFDAPLGIAVNAADDRARGDVYLTVTGTSAECGDDGSAGRGNRVGGLITPFRPMTIESAAGKNPVSHVGKLYSVLAGDIAASLCRRMPQIRAAECLLVSRIGARLDQPWAAEVRVQPAPAVALDALRAGIEEVVRERLGRIDGLRDDLLRGAATLY